MTTAKEHADTARQRVADARVYESHALIGTTPTMLISDAQSARLRWVSALVSLLRFVDALPEPVVVPPVPQPSEEARKRGLLVGAVVRDRNGDVGRVVSHGHTTGRPLVQWRINQGVDEQHLTVIRHAPAAREPNAAAVRRGLYIGARVNIDDTGADVDTLGEIVGWDSAGDPIVEHERWCAAYIASDVTLAGDAS